MGRETRYSPELRERAVRMVREHGPEHPSQWATPEWVDWLNTRRLLEPIGYVPPAEYEARYYEEAKVA